MIFLHLQAIGGNFSIVGGLKRKDLFLFVTFVFRLKDGDKPYSESYVKKNSYTEETMLYISDDAKKRRGGIKVETI